MSEESAEHLVRLYFESKGYLVVTGRKFKIEKGVYPEADIIAINPKTGDRILAEVKAWPIGGRHIRKVWGKDFIWQRRLRIVNDPEFRRKLLEKVQEEYGGKFKVHLFAGGLQPKYADDVRKTIEKEGITLKTMDEVLKELVKKASEKAYSKDPVLQLLIYLRKLKLLK